MLRVNTMLEAMVDRNYFKIMTENKSTNESIVAMTGHIVAKITTLRLLDILLSTEIDIPTQAKFTVAGIYPGENVLQFLNRAW
jgi:hypothetical protein